jgi:hypothetical protein
VQESDRQLALIAATVPNYLKTSTILSEVRLNILGATDSAWDQALIVVDSDASVGLNYSGDAFDRDAEYGIPNIHFITAGEKLAIDSRPLTQNQTLPMGMTQGVDGETYYISMDDRAYDPTMDVYLEDLKTGSIVNMEGSTYSFVHDVNYQGNRFVIHLSANSISVEDLKSSAEPFQVWSTSNEVRIGLTDKALGSEVSIQILDVSGRILYDEQFVGNQNEVRIPLEHNGTLIIVATHEQYGRKVIKTVR